MAGQPLSNLPYRNDPSPEGYIKLRAIEEENEIHFRVKDSTKMQRLFNSFAERRGLPTDQFEFFCGPNRTKIKESDTPSMLNLKEDDIITVELCIPETVPMKVVDSTGITNPLPLELELQLKPSDTMGSVAKQIAERMAYDASQLKVLSGVDMRVLMPDHTMRDLWPHAQERTLVIRNNLVHIHILGDSYYEYYLCQYNGGFDCLHRAHCQRRGIKLNELMFWYKDKAIPYDATPESLGMLKSSINVIKSSDLHPFVILMCRDHKRKFRIRYRKTRELYDLARRYAKRIGVPTDAVRMYINHQEVNCESEETANSQNLKDFQEVLFFVDTAYKKVPPAEHPDGDIVWIHVVGSEIPVNVRMRQRTPMRRLINRYSVLNGKVPMEFKFSCRNGDIEVNDTVESLKLHDGDYIDAYPLEIDQKEFQEQSNRFSQRIGDWSRKFDGINEEEDIVTTSPKDEVCNQQ